MIKQFLIALGAVACLSVAGARWATGQDAVLETFYGSGVHHYFSGDYSRAEADLTAAIDGGSKDPRAYYFRALAKMRSGQDATADLRQAGALETADVNQYYPVGKSLERVQGATRMTIERYRTAARATALAREQRRDAERYDRLERAETQVLRAPAAGPPTKASAVEPTPKAAAPKTAVPEPPAAEDPFAEGAAPKPAAPAVPKTAAPKPPAADDPFAEDAAPKPAAPATPLPQPPADDPFADDSGKKPAADAAAEPAEEMPAEEAPAAKADSDDPFGDPPAKEEAEDMKDEPADAKEAAPEPAPADSEDPFADPKSE